MGSFLPRNGVWQIKHQADTPLHSSAQYAMRWEMPLCTIFHCGVFTKTFPHFLLFLCLFSRPSMLFTLGGSCSPAPQSCRGCSCPAPIPARPKLWPKGLPHVWLRSHLHLAHPHAALLMAAGSLSEQGSLHYQVLHGVSYVCLTSDSSDSCILPSDQGFKPFHTCTSWPSTNQRPVPSRKMSRVRLGNIQRCRLHHFLGSFLQWLITLIVKTATLVF